MDPGHQGKFSWYLKKLHRKVERWKKQQQQQVLQCAEIPPVGKAAALKWRTPQGHNSSKALSNLPELHHVSEFSKLRKHNTLTLTTMVQ